MSVTMEVIILTGYLPSRYHKGARVLAVADAYVNITSIKTAKEELSQDARILAVADAYDAMTSDRPYSSSNES